MLPAISPNYNYYKYLHYKFYLKLDLINLLGNMRMNDFSKFNIFFAESLAPRSGRLFSIFFGFGKNMVAL